jgi:hypothetical protein
MNDECLYRLFQLDTGQRDVRVSLFFTCTKGGPLLNLLGLLYQLVYHYIVYPIVSITQCIAHRPIDPIEKGSGSHPSKFKVTIIRIRLIQGQAIQVSHLPASKSTGTK